MVPAPRQEPDPRVGSGQQIPPPPGFVWSDAFRDLGLSYRRLDYWTRLGLLHAAEPSPGSGTRRRWPEQEVAVARAIVRLCDKLGLRLDQAAPLARAAVESGTTVDLPTLCPGVAMRVGPALWAE